MAQLTVRYPAGPSMMNVQWGVGYANADIALAYEPKIEKIHAGREIPVAANGAY